MGAHVRHDCVRSKCLGDLRAMVKGKISVNSKLHFGLFLTYSMALEILEDITQVL